MDQKIDINEWLDQLDSALAAVAAGDTVVVTRDGHPVAALRSEPGIAP